MNHITELDIYAECINKIKPNAKFALSINSSNEKTLTWYDTDQVEPTKDEISSIRSSVISELSYKLLREQRKDKLLKTDFYFVNDYPHKTDDKKNEWISYRQSLRDLPTNTNISLDNDGTLMGVTWPTEPS
jgi:hypothetical protein